MVRTGDSQSLNRGSIPLGTKRASRFGSLFSALMTKNANFASLIKAKYKF